MAQIVFTSLAHADSVAILTDLFAKAGRPTAARFDARFEQLFDRLEAFPDSGSPRRGLGDSIRIGVVSPYVVIYRHVVMDDMVVVLRILHGRRKISGVLLHS